MKSNATIVVSNPGGFPGSFLDPDYPGLGNYFLQGRFRNASAKQLQTANRRLSESLLIEFH